MKVIMKKILNILQVSSLLSFIVIGIFCGKGDLRAKLIYLAMVCYCFTHLLNVLFFKEKLKDSCFIFLLILVIGSTFLYFRPSLKPSFDINSTTGQLQQEIYNDNGVSVYFNEEAKEFTDIEYLEDYHISEDEAIKALSKIQKVLSLYSGKKPNKIYILNNFKSEGQDVNGFYSFLNDAVVLTNNDNISSTLHHELGHVIGAKTWKIGNLLKINANKDSRNLVSAYACTNDFELFAETWITAFLYNHTTSFSQDISDIFKENIIYFKKPNYINVNDFEENLNKLINKETESFIIKKTDDNMLNNLLQQYPLIKEINRLDVGDEILFYNLKED